MSYQIINKDGEESCSFVLCLDGADLLFFVSFDQIKSHNYRVDCVGRI